MPITLPTTTSAHRRRAMVRVMEPHQCPSLKSPPRQVNFFHCIQLRFINKNTLQGTDAESAYQLIHDELALDGSPLLNLASFVHTWMPAQADKLMQENMSKNLIDQDEYPMTREHFQFKSQSSFLIDCLRNPAHSM